jgi:hypothetical protein
MMHLFPDITADHGLFLSSCQHGTARPPKTANGQDASAPAFRERLRPSFFWSFVLISFDLVIFHAFLKRFILVARHHSRDEYNAECMDAHWE